VIVGKPLVKAEFLRLITQLKANSPIDLLVGDGGMLKCSRHSQLFSCREGLARRPLEKTGQVVVIFYITRTKG
jgi:hypothetical protein